MSRLYDCDIYTKDKASDETIQYIDENNGKVTLYGGKSEEKYAEEVAKDIWEIEKKYINLEISMTYIEELPTETFCFDKKEYKEIMKKDK